MKQRKCCKPDCEKEGYPRLSLDIEAGRWCDEHWEKSGYIKAGKEAFDPAYAGERYEDDY